MSSADGSALPPVSRPEPPHRYPPKHLNSIEAQAWDDGFVEGWRAALRDGSPGEPSEEAIEAAISFANGDAASHTSMDRGSDFSRREWARQFLRAAYAIDGRGTATP